MGHAVIKHLLNGGSGSASNLTIIWPLMPGSAGPVSKRIVIASSEKHNRDNIYFANFLRKFKLIIKENR